MVRASAGAAGVIRPALAELSMSSTATVPEAQAKKLARPRSKRTRLLGVLRVVVGRLPPFAGYFIADRFGDVIYHTARRSRRAAISNMRHVLGRMPRARLKKAVHGVFRNAMRNYYDLCHAPYMTDEQLDRLTDFDEVHWGNVVDQHQKQKGVILATAHFGSFDIITQIITRRGVPVTFLVAQTKPAWLSDFITDLRAARGLNVLLVDAEEGGGLNLPALKEAMRLLRTGGALGVVADRNTEEGGVEIEFFGCRALVASGVAKMALRTGSPIVTGFCHRLPRGRYDVVFDDPIEPVGSASNPGDVRALLRKIFARMEHHISRSPEQWVLLQPVWEDARDKV